MKEELKATEFNLTTENITASIKKQGQQKQELAQIKFNDTEYQTIEHTKELNHRRNLEIKTSGRVEFRRPAVIRKEIYNQNKLKIRIGSGIKLYSKS